MSQATQQKHTNLATLFHCGPAGQHAAVTLSRRVDLDRLFRILLHNEEFLEPRLPHRGYKEKPWCHMNPYEIQFEHTDGRRFNGDREEVVTYTMGITDHGVKFV